MSIWTRLDSFVNLISGAGTINDKAAAASFTTPSRMPFDILEGLYARDGIVNKIISIPADDMTREGIDIKDNNADIYYDYYEKNNIWQHINKALKFSALFGGGFILLDTGDEDTSKPLRVGEEIINYIVVEKKYVYPYPYFKPFVPTKQWRINLPYFQHNNLIWHDSRVIRFDGLDFGTTQRISNYGHGESELELVYEAVKNYHLSHNSIPTILAEYTQGVWKIDSLKESLASKNEEQQAKIKKQFQMMSWAKSIVNNLVMDAKDDFIKRDTSLSNLDNTVILTEKKLVAVTRMPHSLLLGETPGASLGEAGQSQKRDWYDYIRYKQNIKLRQPLNKLNNILAYQLKTKPIQKYEFKSLWQLDDVEAANMRNKQADTDKKYFDMGASAKDILNSRFGTGIYSTQTTITSIEDRQPKQPQQIDNKDNQEVKVA